jgi:hypothetical protein
MKHDFEKFLASLDLHDSEMFGLFGRGFPGSFYKVYVRAQPKQKWWCVKYEAEPVQYDPIECEKKIAVRDRVANVWGPLTYFLIYDFMPSARSLDRLATRVSQLCGKMPEQHVHLTHGPPIWWMGSRLL